MAVLQGLDTASALAPVGLMGLAALWPLGARVSVAGAWRWFLICSVAALVVVGLGALSGASHVHLMGVLKPSPLGLTLAVLVQCLGTVIGGFSARYLEGESGQKRFITALSSVLASVHVLLMADHWVALILAWALVGVALQHLLCFYPERPFARLAAHKKRMADRLADALLVTAAVLAWREVGSGSLSELWSYLDQPEMSGTLQLSAVLLVLAVILRTALMPVHGWLIQVMEAPTPVSALLHAGVVNLGGFVLIRFAPLLEHAAVARTLLVVFGLLTAVLAGMVMLTRISIKVRLAWSTVAQMGFMVLECGLGLYTLAALHLIGHSLYKAHTFLAASTVVRHTRLKAMHGTAPLIPISLWVAPVLTISVVAGVHAVSGAAAWPWWWSGGLGLAWGPLLWLSAHRPGLRAVSLSLIAGVLMVAGLTGATLLGHLLPLQLQDAPQHTLGQVALAGLVGLYLCLVALHLRPQALRTWRRWSYAGFYVDEVYTRLALQLWPVRWAPKGTSTSSHASP